MAERSRPSSSATLTTSDQQCCQNLQLTAASRNNYLLPKILLRAALHRLTATVECRSLNFDLGDLPVGGLIQQWLAVEFSTGGLPSCRNITSHLSYFVRGLL